MKTSGVPDSQVGNLENSILSGIRWNLVLSFAGQFCNIGITLVLSRLLDPTDFGMLAAALAVVVVIESFGSLGGTAALTQRSSISDQFYTAVFIVGGVLAILMILVIGGLSPFLSAFYGKPDLQKIFLVLSLSIPFQFLETFPLAELQRRLAFERIASTTFFTIIIAGGISLYLAYEGYGWIALVVRLLLLQILRTLSFCFLAWPKFHFVFGKKEIRELLHFGIPQSFSQFISLFGRRVDDILIGKFMGTGILGIYSLAYGLYTWPIANIKGRISQVAFAALAKVNTDRDAMADYYLKVVSLATLIGYPAIFGFASVCDLAVPVVMGEKWLPAVNVLRILGIASLFEICMFPGAIYQATARTRTFLKATILARVTTIIGILAGLYFGLTGIAVSIVITSFISLFIYNYFVRKLISVTNVMLFQIMLKNGIFSVLMFAVILLFRFASQGYFSSVTELVLSLMLGVVSYGLLMKRFRPELLRKNSIG
ncbi:lipopolysaccharide biosynthesis protein [Dyadobacter luticola]|uniref:Lipopolysaccharide biosynthesis protein n=1 Tax=Dyadobacter luticola TaxID=1979387 RepID=A0A5R9KVH7_9BACT|nr:lipopolysaccharide biosynthesis protein [Dyadobacter luticola]TLV00067.1 lipopolysaccharide biosynthesis protein [Dyadobacter luticola]